MPRPLFRKNTDRSLQTKQSSQGFLHVSFEERLRQKRSAEYLQVFNDLDTGEKLMSQAKAQQIIDAVRAEFSDLPASSGPIGIVAACFLGDPYEVHTVDLETGMIRHYQTSESLPAILEQARSIAQHPSYAYIEVYSDCLCAIDKNGEVSVIK